MPELRRVMLVEIKARRPSAPSFATWNPADKHADIALSNGNLTATKTTLNATAFRSVRATEAMWAGQWYWETVVQFTGTADFAVGIATDQWVGHVTPPGQAANPYAVAVYKSGTVFFNDGPSPHGSLPALANGDVIRHHWDADTGTYRMARNNGAWVTVWVADSLVGGWKPILALKRPSGTTCSCTAAFGAAAFTYAVPGGLNPGVYKPQPPTPVQIYLSSEPFGTGPTDTPPNRAYDARIVADQDTEIVRAAGCWVWGNATEAKSGQVVVTNVDGKLDVWADYDWRDAEINIFSGREGQTRGDFELWTRSYVENIAFDEQRIAIRLADPLALFDAPIQQQVYPESHPIEAEIGKPIPITFGLPFYVSGVRQSPLKLGADAYAWQLHDGLNPLLNSKGTVFDNGIDISAHCVAWPAIGAIKGFRVNGTAPFGKVTTNPSGFGSTTVLTIVQQAVARLPADRMAAPAVVQQPGGVAGINAWAALYIREPRTILDVIRAAMDSVCGWAVPNRAGTQLQLGRVRDPMSVSPGYVLDPACIRGNPVITLDVAKGLTTRIAGRRNYSPHQWSEIADSIKDPNSPTYNPNLTANLQSDYMATRTGTPAVINESQVSAAYAQARQAPAKPTLLQDATHIKIEANRVCTDWYPTRHFIRVPCDLSVADAEALEVGTVVRFDWPRFGIGATAPVKAGNQFLVVMIKERFWARTAEVLLWGSLPITTYGGSGGAIEDGKS